MHHFYLRRSCTNPRLFQQACRFASTGRRKDRAPNVKLDKDEADTREDGQDADIRWFEEDVETGVRRRVQGNPEEVEARELRQKIKDLEADLKQYESPNGEEALMAALTPEERAKVQRAAERQKKENRMRTADLDLDIGLKLPPLTVPMLKRLNQSLRESAMNPTNNLQRKDLWRWYSRAKYNIPALARMIPKKAWKVLWEVQSVKSLQNPERPNHVIELLDDMASIGMIWTPEQKEARVESLVAMNQIEKAIGEWETEYNRTRGAHLGVLETGVGLLADAGDLDRSLELLRECFDKHPGCDPRIILLLLSAFTRDGNSELAYSLYLFMRSKLGDQMTMNDYDTISLSFMLCNEKGMALAVFRDMMLQGKRPPSLGPPNEQPEHELYETVFHRLDDLPMYDSDIPTSLNKIRLSAMGTLPSEWQNKFFFGSWLKKLLGMGEVDAADRVVQLMYERGLQPDAKHVNGLIGAYLRSGNAELEQKGEKYGWSMIQKRLEFAWERRRRARGELDEPMPIVSKSEDGLNFPESLDRPSPQATMETFNALALFYIDKKRIPYILHLYSLIRPAELHMDSTFVNQLLYTRLHTRYGPKGVWQDFVKYARTHTPDVETYNCLWTAQLQALDRRRTPKRLDPKEFPPPRQLFYVMVSWFASLNDKGKATAVEQFDADIMSNIIQAFLEAKDYAACVVALHGLSATFQAYPTTEIARAVIVAFSNANELDVGHVIAGGRRRQIPKSKTRLDELTKTLSGLVARRAELAASHGIDHAEFSPDERAKENLDMLSEFIRTVLVRQSNRRDKVEASIGAASREMGLPGIRTGDVDASNI